MKKHKKCQFSESCPENGEYSLYRTMIDGKKVWINVCDEHEKIVAKENLAKVGGYLGRNRNVRDAHGDIIATENISRGKRNEKAV